MTDTRPAPTGESNFAYDHPALVATVVTLIVAGAFIYAIYASAVGHHGPTPGAHGSNQPMVPGSTPVTASAPKPAAPAR